MGGFQLLAFYDAARRLKLDHHLINDERCGVFAADAYAKVSGRVGLVDATLGARRHQPGDRAHRGAQRRHAAGGLRRRHPPSARLEEHDAGGAPDRDPQACLQGPAAHRAHQPHPRADPPRVPDRHLRPAGPGGGRCAGGHLPRHAALQRGGVRGRCALRGGAGDPLPAGGRRHRARCQAAGRGQAAADAVRRRRAHLAGRRRCQRLRPRPQHPRRPHHDRQGRDCLHRSAERRSVRALRPHRQRADRRGRRAADRRLQAGRDRHQALHHPAQGQDRHPSRYRRRGVRPHLPADGGAVGRRARGHPRSGGGALGRRQAAASRARGLRRERGQAHGGVEGRRHGAPHLERDPHQRGAHAARAQRRDAGRRHSGRRRRLCRALGRAALRHQAGGARLRAGSRLRLDRLRPARRHRRGAGGQGARRSCRSPATAASTCRSAISRRRGAWACRLPSSSSTTRPRAT